jgi:hypothetical protein
MTGAVKNLHPYFSEYVLLHINCNILAPDTGFSAVSWMAILQLSYDGAFLMRTRLRLIA